jgi:hypothetical protein
MVAVEPDRAFEMFLCPQADGGVFMMLFRQHDESPGRMAIQRAPWLQTPSISARTDGDFVVHRPSTAVRAVRCTELFEALRVPCILRMTGSKVKYGIAISIGSEQSPIDAIHRQTSITASCGLVSRKRPMFSRPIDGGH